MTTIVDFLLHIQEELISPTKGLLAEDWLPDGVGKIGDHQTALPRIAKNAALIAEIERTLPQIPTHHDFYNADARRLDFLEPESLHLIVTSPPYWTLKQYRDHPDQLGAVVD